MKKGSTVPVLWREDVSQVCQFMIRVGRMGVFSARQMAEELKTEDKAAAIARKQGFIAGVTRFLEITQEHFEDAFPGDIIETVPADEPEAAEDLAQDVLDVYAQAYDYMNSDDPPVLTDGLIRMIDDEEASVAMNLLQNGKNGHDLNYARGFDQALRYWRYAGEEIMTEKARREREEQESAANLPFGEDGEEA